MYRFMCYEKFHSNATILPKLSLFYFSVKAVSNWNPRVFSDTCKRWYLDQKPVSYLWNLSQESSFQSRKNQKTAKVKFNKRTDFHWFKSCLFACLNCFYELNLWYPSQTTVCLFFFFIWCLKIIMTSYVRSYFQSKYFLQRGFGRNIYAEVETSWKRFPEVFTDFFSIDFFLMSDVKLL